MGKEVEIYEANMKLPRGVRTRVTKALARFRSKGACSFLRYVLCSDDEWMNKSAFYPIDRKLQQYRTDYRKLEVILVHLDLEEAEKQKLGYKAISLIVSRY